MQLPRLFSSGRMSLVMLLSGAMLLLLACSPNGFTLPVRPSAAPAPLTESMVPPAGSAVPTTTVAFQPEELTLTLETVVEALDAPVFATHANDDRLFIVEKAGTIRLLIDGALLDTPFLDITDLVNSNGNEQGLLGLAFAPNYSASGFFFVNYTDTNGDTMIARYQVSGADPNQADAASAFVVLQLEQPASNHNGGMVAFGPDGYLYIGTGDGGGGGDRYGNGQNPATLLGKMLRLDVTSDPAQPYTIPADNPWVTADWDGQDVNDEIWAVGLRNPWRYSFDRATGDLWIGDVGQNQMEEIDYTPADSGGGLNYGWPMMEASACYNSDECDTDGLVLPVAEYSHSGHCSVTGGYVYRGAAFPALQGVYLYGDYCSGTLWATWFNADGAWHTAIVLEDGGTLSSFAEDHAGELYVTDLNAGTLSRIVVTETTQ